MGRKTPRFLYRIRPTIIRMILVAYFTLWWGPMPGIAAETQPSVSALDSPMSWRQLPDYMIRTFPFRLLAGAQETFFRLDHLTWLALAGGAAGVVQIWDDDIQTFFRDEQPFATGEDLGNTLGHMGVLYGVTGLTYGMGELTRMPRLSQTGIMMFEALSITAPVTTLLKVSVRRRRPDGSNRLSFPSLHAAGSFTLATVVMQHHGLWVGIPAYLTATWVAMSRMQKDKHFFSDTLFGAVLGTVIGNAVVRVHRRSPREARLLVLPVASRHAFGFVVAGRY